MIEPSREIPAASETWSAEEVLGWAFAKFRQECAIASAFGAEGMVLIDMASRLFPQFRLFTLDTEFLFPETYELMARVEMRYGVRVERVYSHLTPEEQEHKHGPALWSRDPDRCCHLRKIEPLKRKLAELQAWISAIRRDQTAARSTAKKVEWDDKFQIIKVNPLADWSGDKVWQYIRKHNVPYNPRHEHQYPSIGCTHCTRAVKPGEDPRAGRWSKFAKTECGLHYRDPQPPLNAISAEANPSGERDS